MHANPTPNKNIYMDIYVCAPSVYVRKQLLPLRGNPLMKIVKGTNYKKCSCCLPENNSERFLLRLFIMPPNSFFQCNCLHVCTVPVHSFTLS